jgi:ATP synthase protein I
MADDLDRLAAQLDQIYSHKKAVLDADTQRQKNADNMSQGVRAGMELTAPIVAGAALGWALDKGLDSAPVGLIIMLLLGVFTGFYNVWRVTQNAGSAVGFSQLHKRKKEAKTLPVQTNWTEKE